MVHWHACVQTCLLTIIFFIFFHLIQSPFVLCRLFKKQDASIDGPNCDETEPTVISPTPGKSSPEDTQSELEGVPPSPFGVQADEHPARTEYSGAENSDGATSDIVAPHDYISNSFNGCEAGDQVSKCLSFWLIYSLSFHPSFYKRTAIKCFSFLDTYFFIWSAAGARLGKHVLWSPIWAIRLQNLFTIAFADACRAWANCLLPCYQWL